MMGGSANMVEINVIKGNHASGLVVIVSQSNTISANMLLGNAGDGIFLDAASSGNTISGNTAMNDGLAFGGFDLLDLSNGSGTAGTANTWTGNKALTRRPSSLM